MALYKKYVRYEAFQEIRSPQFSFWNPHRISETNAARKLKFGTLCSHLRVLGFHIEICPLLLGRSGAPHFMLVPLYIAETYQPRK